MAQKERGIADASQEQQPSASGSSSPVGSSDSSTSLQSPTQAEQTMSGNSTNVVVGKDSTGHPRAKAALGWGQLLWEKWRWGLLIAVAVVISRFSSTT